MFKFIIQCLVLVILVRNGCSIDRIEVDLCENCNHTSYKLVNLTVNDDVVKLQAPRECAFYIIQVHHQFGESVLSPEPSTSQTHSVRGRNLGLVQINNGSSHTFYSLNLFNNTKVLFAVTSYTAKAPIPGGCNLESNTTIAPHLNVTYDNNVRVVEIQKSCIKSATYENASMDLYYANAEIYDFSEQSYFAMIINMLTVQNITKHGILTLRPYQGSQLRRLFSNYISVGVAYNAVVNGAEGSIAYVPCVSYGTIASTAESDINVSDYGIIVLFYSIFSAGYLFNEAHSSIIIIQLFTLVFWITSAIITYWNLPRPYYFRFGIAFVTLPLQVLCAYLWPRKSVNVNLTLTLIVILYSFALPQNAMYYNYSLWLLLTFAFPLCYLLTHHMHSRLASWMMTLLPLLILLDFAPGSSKYSFYAYIDIVRAATVKNFWMATRSLPLISWTALLMVGGYLCLTYAFTKIIDWCVGRLSRRRNYSNLDENQPVTGV